MPSVVGDVVGLLVGWLVSSFAVWLALKIFPGKQRREDFVGAMITAAVGALVYWFFHAVFHIPVISGILGFSVWLYALRKIQHVGWLGAFALAILIYLLNGVLSLFLPTLKI